MIMGVNDYNFSGQRVLLRVDFNVPLNENREILDATRITAALPTIDKIIKDGGVPVIISHLGRPKGEVVEKYSLKPVADYLTKLGYKVLFHNDCVGEAAVALTKEAKNSEIVLLENLRFHKEEEKNDASFAAELAKNGEVYVNDAFGAAHRSHSSVDAVAHLFSKRFAGLLMQKELEYLGDALAVPKHPFTAIIGGAKISGKIDVINNLLSKCDYILIGGGMAFTFYKAMGLNIGNSLVEEDKIDLANELLEKTKQDGAKIILPVDAKVATAFDNNAETKIVDVEDIPNGWMGLDIANKTIAKFTEIILSSKTIVWNGPMGVFEMSNFSNGTKSIAQALVQATANGAITIVGGGDSAAAVNQLGLADGISHISTGGGASLEFLEGKVLPGVAALV